MEKIANERSRHLPVIRDERFVGLVSIGDMIKHQLAECHAAARCDRDRSRYSRWLRPSFHILKINGPALQEGGATDAPFPVQVSSDMEIV
jgi:hypothetical protein